MWNREFHLIKKKRKGFEGEREKGFEWKYKILHVKIRMLHATYTRLHAN